MIVMVSTKTFSARDPDHSARMKPTEITSKRPPLKHVVEGRRDDRCRPVCGGQRPRRQMSRIELADLRRTWAGLNWSKT